MLFGNSKLLFYCLLFFFFRYFAVYAQSIEEEIYKAVDEFVVTKSLSDLQKKEEELEKKVATKEAQLALVILLCNKAYYLNNKNYTKDAIVSYEKAWKLFSSNKLTNYDIVSFCLQPLGDLYIKRKDYTNAENSIKHYIFLAERDKNIEQKVDGTISLSLLYQSLGNYKKVIEIVDEVLKDENISVHQKNKLTVIKNESLLFVSNVTTNFFNNDFIKYQQLLKNNQYKEADKYFKKALKKTDLERFSSREKAKLFLQEAQLYFLLQNNEASRKSIIKSLRQLVPKFTTISALQKEGLYAETLLIDALDLLSQVTENPSKKLHFYDYSFYIANLLEKGVTSQETKVIHQNDNRKRSENCIAILYKLYQDSKKDVYFEKALRYAEKYKSGVVKERVHKRTLLEKYPKDSLLLLEKKLLIQQEKLTNELIVEQTSASRASKISQINKELHALSIDLKNIQKQLQEKYGDESDTSFSLVEVSKISKRDKFNLVCFFFGKNAIYQFIVNAEENKFIKIELSESLQNDILSFIRFFDAPNNINNNVEGFVKKAFSVYQNLNLDKVSESKKLMLIPDGILNFIPFEALLSNEVSGFNYSTMPFLVKKHQIVYSTNITSLIRNSSKNKYDKVLGFFPVFENTNNELRYSLEEEKSIKKITKATTFLHQKATKQNFINQINDFNVLHLSTHAIGVNPYVDFYDGKLTLNELYGLDLQTNLAVLSACETGVGNLTKGEGALSVARGFQYAGVKNVVFSLWEINDKSTSIVMDFFYRSLWKTKSVNYANQQAKIDYLEDERIENSKKSPYYWGAFVYYGTFEEITKSTNCILMSLLGVVLLFFIYKLVNRNKV